MLNNKNSINNHALHLTRQAGEFYGKYNKLDLEQETIEIKEE